MEGSDFIVDYKIKYEEAIVQITRLAQLSNKGKFIVLAQENRLGPWFKH